MLAETKLRFLYEGALPKGWDSGVTGNEKAKWEVVREVSFLMLKQSGEAMFSWPAKTDEHIKNGLVEMTSDPSPAGKTKLADSIFGYGVDAKVPLGVCRTYFEGQ